MRICSLVPGATEIVAALGLADDLVGISHECDYPASVRHARVLVEPLVGGDRDSSDRIDQQVKNLVSSGRRLYRLNERAFVEANPETVLIQDLCHVCAVTPDQLDRAIQSLACPPQLVTLNPTTLDCVLKDIERIGVAVAQSENAKAFATALRDRLAVVRTNCASSSVRPRVVCLEWLSPLYIGGHWVPEMVDLAGGQDVLGQADQPSREVSWEEVRAAKPDIVILMPCGFTVERTLGELDSLLQRSDDWSRAITDWPMTFAVDAASYFSRPGPRLVDGVELLASIVSGQIDKRFGKTAVRRLVRSADSVTFHP